VRRALRLLGVTGLVWVAVGALFLVSAAGIARGADGAAPLFGPKVAVVELEGLIADVDQLVRDLKQRGLLNDTLVL